VDEVESPTAELALDEASSAYGAVIVRGRRGSGCRKSVSVLSAIVDQKSTSSKPSSATPIRSVDQSPVSRPNSRPVTAFSVNVLLSSGKIISPRFDERQLRLDIGFVFIQAPLRAKCFTSMPMTD